MSSKNEKVESRIDYLNEHLFYERQMLGFTFSKYQGIDPIGDRLHWNAVFESFCIHARVLYDFLTSNGNQNSHKARHYVGAYDPSGLKYFETINIYVFHCSTRRSENKKFDTAGASEVALWIDREWASWVGMLSEPYRALADPAPVCIQHVSATGGAPSATNYVTTTTASVSKSVIYTGSKAPFAFPVGRKPRS